MAIEYLNKVGIANAPSRMKQYPFQLSGGLRQRILIAMVLSAQPDLLIADEPTTALDVTIQKQVLTLLNGLKKDMNAGILFITHDLGVVAEIADRVIVLYAGRKVEEGSTEQIFTHPAHPYTIGLMNAVPDVDKDGDDMEPIPGMFPNITEVIPGCRFNPRCPHAAECSLCKQEVPSLTEIEPGHYAACHLVKKEVQP
jgi:oligopeptide transport system ATP-binding protein